MYGQGLEGFIPLERNLFQVMYVINSPYTTTVTGIIILPDRINLERYVNL